MRVDRSVPWVRTSWSDLGGIHGVVDGEGVLVWWCRHQGTEPLDLLKYMQRGGLLLVHYMMHQIVVGL